jgi:hypothetical protein
MQDYMNDSVRMRVTQVLERSRINIMPVSVSFRTKTIWYTFLYWLSQSFIIACVYGDSAWFLPLFNLVTVGWAWDKITSQHSSLVESVINIDDSINPERRRTPDLESPEVLPKTRVMPTEKINTSSSSMFTPMEESAENSSLNTSDVNVPLFSHAIINDSMFGSSIVQTGSIIGPDANPVVNSYSEDEKKRDIIADKIGDNLDNAVEETIQSLNSAVEKINDF